MTRRSTAALLVAALAAAAAAAAPAEELLAPERLARLPAAERAAWERYLEASRRRLGTDRAALEAERAELKASGGPRAPEGRSLALRESMTAEWFRGAEARRLADAVVSFQTPSGGWSKNIDMAAGPRRKGQGYTTTEGWHFVGTFDNNATTEHLRFLGRALEAHGDAAHRRALEAGLEYVLEAQYPNGCWPQVYPLEGGYHDAATYNDDAMVRILRLLQEVDERGGWVPGAVREKARAALARGLECVLASQVVVEGRPTVWCAQHHPLTLAPVGARGYEHPSLSGQESAGILEFLMALPAPGARVVAAVRGGVGWLRAHAIQGFAYEDCKLVPRPGAGPVWARFYELGTSRPIFSDRDGVVRYRLEEVGEERRRGYAWYSTRPAAALRAYEAWSPR
jgi:PelA/Pel-15E family pectate lyase